MNIADGTYAARPGAASVYESQGGALVLALVVKVADGPELKSYHTLVNKDGAINTRTVDNLKAWSGWDGADPFWFMEQDLSNVEVEIVIANEPGFQDPTRMFPKVKWINPPGGGGSGVPEAADRRTVLAKYGAKFRALSGGVPCGRLAAGQKSEDRSQKSEGSATAAGVPSPAPMRPAVRAVPPVPVRPPVIAGSTQAAAWGRLCQLGANLTPDKREAIWFVCVDATGMDQVDMTPAGWAQVTAKIEAHFSGLVPAGAPVDAGVPADDDPFR
jgi:hypothetical protein